jgi:hypothetical protein
MTRSKACIKNVLFVPFSPTISLHKSIIFLFVRSRQIERMHNNNNNNNNIFLFHQAVTRNKQGYNKHWSVNDRR